MMQVSCRSVIRLARGVTLMEKINRSLKLNVKLFILSNVIYRATVLTAGNIKHHFKTVK